MSLDPVVLEGAHVRLEPLAPRHVADLAVAGADPEVWRWMPVAAPAGEAEMAAIVDGLLARAAAGVQAPFAQVDISTGRAVGATSYLDIALEDGRIEIGWTWIGRPWWRTAINSEAKLLLLGHAFDTLGLNRSRSRPTSATSARRRRSSASAASARASCART